MKLVIDVNVVLSALLRGSTTRKLILESSDNLYFPEPSLEKIQKYKEYILEKSGLSVKEFDKLLEILFKYIKLVPTKDLQNHWSQAKKIMEHIDTEDVVFIAAALALDAAIWSDDKHFERQKAITIRKTSDMV
ncbi:DNA-binding protein [Candidatus Woesearchaeota archaeon]|nr:DNA-binding protein [Candidatus Woesearchaeota archaeon]